MKPHYHPYLKDREEPFPSNRFWLWLLDRIVMIAGIVGPMCTVPQIVVIYGGHHASGVSPTSWVLFAILDIPWILYGRIHRQPPIFYSYLLWLIANTVVAIGAVVYR